MVNLHGPTAVSKGPSADAVVEKLQRDRNSHRLSVAECNCGLPDKVAEVEGVHFWKIESTLIAKDLNEGSERQ